VIPAWKVAGESTMMGRQDRDQGQLFYEFSLDEMIPSEVRSCTRLKWSFTTERPNPGCHRMSAILPIVTEAARRRNMSRRATALNRCAITR
jgi:hypothetical protein